VAMNSTIAVVNAEAGLIKIIVKHNFLFNDI
jgi:hypothetical protein